jgi:hypothetical protein
MGQSLILDVSIYRFGFCTRGLVACIVQYSFLEGLLCLIMFPRLPATQTRTFLMLFRAMYVASLLESLLDAIATCFGHCYGVDTSSIVPSRLPPPKDIESGIQNLLSVAFRSRTANGVSASHSRQVSSSSSSSRQGTNPG